MTEGSAAYPAVAEEPGASGGLAARPDPTCALSAGPIGRPKSGWCRLSSGGRFRLTLRAGGRWIRTIGPWRQAVGSVMENVDNLAEPAGRLSQSATLRGCYVPALVKGSMAWLVCLPVGQALLLASSYRSTLFFFRRGTNGSNPFPSSRESGEIVGSTTLARRRRCFTAPRLLIWELSISRAPLQAWAGNVVATSLSESGLGDDMDQ